MPYSDWTFSATLSILHVDKKTKLESHMTVCCVLHLAFKNLDGVIILAFIQHFSKYAACSLMFSKKLLRPSDII